MKLVVIDDSKVARKAIISKIPPKLLEKLELFEGENGKEAVFLQKTVSPDLMFLDLTMPVMTGYEALEEIMKINPNAKVVVVTADVQPKAQDMVMRLGAMDYFKKDIDARAIESIFQRMGWL